MQLAITDEDVSEFRTIYLRVFGEEISAEEAKEKIKQLDRLYLSVDPLPEKEPVSYSSQKTFLKDHAACTPSPA